MIIMTTVLANIKIKKIMARTELKKSTWRKLAQTDQKRKIANNYCQNYASKKQQFINFAFFCIFYSKAESGKNIMFVIKLDPTQPIMRCHCLNNSRKPRQWAEQIDMGICLYVDLSINISKSLCWSVFNFICMSICLYGF